jgi:spore germination cell wall hydrolase CwlJ-like protein
MISSALSSARLLEARQAVALLRTHPRRSAGAGLLVLGAAAGLAMVARPSGAVPMTPQDGAASAPAAVQELTPFAVRQVGRDEAQRLNAALPLASGPNPAAAPFVLKADSKTYARALECLTQAIYYEAARESEDGQRAVAQVVLNRMRHPAYPASVCAVVYQGAERPTGCQFSFTCDGSLGRAPMRSYWDRARLIAHQALQGYVHAPVGNATHYHANYVMPYWAPTLVKNAVIGLHIFYRWPGSWGQPSAFAQKWSRKEADPWLLRSAALAAEARHAAAAAGTPQAEGEEVIVQAKQELPPELARLVEAEIGPKGETRVALTIKQPRRDDPGARDNFRQLDRALGDSSTSLKWGLTGRADGTEEQAPLGRKTQDRTAAAAAAQ